VDILVVKCEACGEIYRIYPSFVIKGTTLTLTALIFVAFIYEYSKLVWRDIPEKFCDEHNRIAHSTIYKAVHGLGKSIDDHGNKIKDAIQKLHDKYVKELSIDLVSDSTIPKKSLYEHTMKREMTVRFLLSPFLIIFNNAHAEFPRIFYSFTRSAGFILSNIDPPVCNIYKK
jgi:hypothetical protein